MFTSFGVLLDACVLVPNWLRDLLLTAAERNLYRPLWSEEILDEMERALVRQCRVPADRASYTRNQMSRAFPEAVIGGYQLLIPAMPVNQKDRHVLAAAVLGHAQLIITANIADFPAAALQPLHITALTPDDFLLDLLARFPHEIYQCLRFMSEQTGRVPGKSALSTYDITQAIGKLAPGFAANALIQLGIV